MSEDSRKSHDELLAELDRLRHRLSELERSSMSGSTEDYQELRGELIRLGRREEAFRMVVEGSPEFFFYAHDRDGKFTYLSPSVEEVTGIAIEDFKKHYTTYLTDNPINRNVVEQTTRSLADGGGQNSYLVELRHGKGHPIMLQIYERPVYEEGRIVGLQGVAHEVTDRIRSERRLRESEELYRLLFESTMEGVLIADLKDKSFIHANPAICRMLGYEESELLGLSVLDIHPPEQLNRVVGHFTSLAKGETKIARNIPCLRKDGTVFYADISASQITVRGREANVGFFRDITDRLWIESERLRTQKLESLTVLAGGIAHDFNNLLTAILGNLSIARLRAAGIEGVEDRLLESERATFRARDLTRQLLEFAKGGTPVKKPSSISELIVETVEFALRGSNVIAEFDLPGELWWAEIDQGQFAQVVNNLAMNAIQAMPQGGVFLVDARNLESTNDNPLLDPAKSYIRIDFRDTGQGIPPEIIDKIFDPYFTTKKTGSGLGLATTYAIVSKHGGHISAFSSPDGAVFHVYMPALPKGQDIRESEQVIHLGAGRILVMDDDPLVRKAMRDMLESLGFEPAFAATGEEALVLLDEARDSGSPFLAVILDLTIKGGMGGLATVKRMREREPALKAIVTSGYPNDPAMTAPRDHGFNARIPKPIKLAELSETLKKVIE